MSSRIAAHVGDMIKLKKSRDLDLEMGHARRDLDWDRQFAVAMNPARAKAIRAERMPGRYRRVHDVRRLLRHQDCQPPLQILITSYLPRTFFHGPSTGPSQRLWQRTLNHVYLNTMQETDLTSIKRSMRNTARERRASLSPIEISGISDSHLRKPAGHP